MNSSRSIPAMVSLVFLLIVMVAVSACASAQTGSSVTGSSFEDQLSREYAGSERMMRTFYAENHLRFDAQGANLGKSPVGPWTIFGRIRIDQVRLQPSSLRFDGQRLPVAFDDAGKKWKPLHWESKWSMEIATQPGPQQAGQIEAALKKIFLAPDEDPAAVMPDYWQEFMHRLNGQAIPGDPCEAYVSEAVSDSIQPGGASPVQVSEGVMDGRKINDVAPVYLGFARVSSVEGVIRVRAVISKTGDVNRICLLHVAGAGLDDEVVRAVRHWKYQPYLLNGVPVAIKTTVSVQFRLK